MNVILLHKGFNTFWLSNKLCQSLCRSDTSKPKNVAPGVRFHLQFGAGPTLMLATDVEMKQKPKLSSFSGCFILN